MVLVAGVCFGQQRLVVPPFQNRNSGIDTTQIETLTDLFINAIQRTNRFEVPDRDALALLMREHKFQMSDWSDDAKTVEMGRVLNANYIMRVIVSKIDTDVYLMIARLLDVNTAQILDSDELEFTSVRDARTRLDTFARDCLDNIRTSRETVQQQQRTQQQQAQQAAQAQRDSEMKNKILGQRIGTGFLNTVFGIGSIVQGDKRGWVTTAMEGTGIIFLSVGLAIKPDKVDVPSYTFHYASRIQSREQVKKGLTIAGASMIGGAVLFGFIIPFFYDKPNVNHASLVYPKPWDIELVSTNGTKINGVKLTYTIRY
jgi:hypothetical protein